VSSVQRRIRGSVGRVARRAARRYVPGPLLADALAARTDAHGRGLTTTLAYWDKGSDDPSAVEGQATRAIEALAGQDDAELSLKLPALGLDPERVKRIAVAARAAEVRLHCDSHGTETQDATLELACACRPPLGITLPARWRRSAADAGRAIAAGARVRVVKGQWADDSKPEGDMRKQFLELVDHLAGRAALVEVATHDAPLAELAAQRLEAAGTAFELQVLYGLPAREVEAAARGRNATLRLYVPYGSAYLPYALRSVLRNPRAIARLGRDLIGVPEQSPFGSRRAEARPVITIPEAPPSQRQRVAAQGSRLR
jgi:proline dehydrogenase